MDWTPNFTWSSVVSDMQLIAPYVMGTCLLHVASNSETYLVLLLLWYVLCDRYGMQLVQFAVVRPAPKGRVIW